MLIRNGGVIVNGYQPKKELCSGGSSPNCGSSVTGGCDHDYKHIETVKKSELKNYSMTYTKLDRYYCSKCLDEKEKIRKEERLSHEKLPEWW